MKHSIINQRILEYVELYISLSLANNYNAFLRAGKKVDRNKLKFLGKLVKSKSTDLLEKNILEILSPVVDVPIIEVLKKCDFTGVKKNVSNISSSFRVKKYRDSIKKKGYKNLSLQLPSDVFKDLKTLKLKKQMTYSELISFLINQ